MGLRSGISRKLADLIRINPVRGPAERHASWNQEFVVEAEGGFEEIGEGRPITPRMIGWE